MPRTNSIGPAGVHAMSRPRRRHVPTWLALAMVVLAVTVPGHAESFSTADLAGTWRVFQLATPPVNVNASAIRSYRGTAVFDATGAIADVSSIANDQQVAYMLTGNLSISDVGIVTGTLTLNAALTGAAAGSFAVREARMLATKHTIVGAATVRGQVGLFTFVKLEPTQKFTIDGDLAGGWGYHEINPAMAFLGRSPTWTTGSIIFHGSGSPFPGAGCSEADLTFADGTRRASLAGNGSFG
jgi:hypothetical protein